MGRVFAIAAPCVACGLMAWFTVADQLPPATGALGWIVAAVGWLIAANAIDDRVSK